MSDLLEFFAPKQQAMIDLLKILVGLESPSREKRAVDRLMDTLAQHFEASDALVERHPRREVGDILLAKWNDGAPGKPIMILSHLDTVWPVGTLEDSMPLQEDDEGRLFGPGILDMKGGVVVALTAVQGLQERREFPQRPIWFLATTDEEIGSKHSRAMIEDLANHCALVLVTEPPNSDGSLKGWRKGVASYKLEIEGRAAHAGNEPEKGINSIIEFAQQALELNSYNNLKYGTSVSVTVVEGGTTTNVIPAKTVAYVDTRMVSRKEFEALDAKILDRHNFVPGAKVSITRTHQRPPMERDDATIEQAKQIAQNAGITVRVDGAGGGSDGNLTANLGIPTLDGLGAEGLGLHAKHEHVLMNSLPRKAALMAALIRDWTG